MHITLYGTNVCVLAIVFVLQFLSVVYLFSSLSHSFFHVDSAKGNTRCAFAQRRILPPGENHPPTSYEPNVLDDFHYSETSEMIFQEDSGDKDAVPSYLFDADLDDETIGKALSSPLFIQEREEPADRRQTYHSHEESCCQLSPFSHTQERRDPCTNSVRVKNENQVATWKTKESKFSLKDKKSKSSQKLEQRFRNTDFKPILIGEVFRN